MVLIWTKIKISSLELLNLRVCNDSNFASDKIKLKEASCNTFHQTYMYLCIWNNPTNLTVSLTQSYFNHGKQCGFFVKKSSLWQYIVFQSIMIKASITLLCILYFSFSPYNPTLFSGHPQTELVFGRCSNLWNGIAFHYCSRILLGLYSKGKFLYFDYLL